MSDDAFIHLGFAKGILETGRFSFAGRITNGSTAPLWAILTSFILKIGFPFEWSIRLLSGLGSLFTVFLFRKILILKRYPFSEWMLLSILVVHSGFIQWTLTGMEACFAMGGILFLYYLQIREKDSVFQSITYWIIAGLFPLIRPEFVVFYALSFIFLVHKEKFKTLLFFLTGLIPVLFWSMVAVGEFGAIIPNTYYVKASGSLFQFRFDYLFRNLKVFLAGNVLELVFIVMLFFVSILNRKLKEFTLVLKKRENLFLYSALFTFYGYYTLKNVAIISRYSLVLVPVLILLLLDIFQYYNTINRKLSWILFTSYFILYLFYHLSLTIFIFKPERDKFVSGFQREYKKIAFTIKEDSTVKEKSVCLTDVGIIGVYSGAIIYDILGLTDHNRFQYKSLKEYITANKPAYLIHRGEYNVVEILSLPKAHTKIKSITIPSLGYFENPDIKVDLYKLDW